MKKNRASDATGSIALPLHTPFMQAITQALGRSLNAPLNHGDLSSLSDSALLESTHRVAAREHETTQTIIEHWAEVDRRRTYLALGFSSLHELAVKSLKLSDGAAARRIQAVRLSRFLCRLK